MAQLPSHEQILYLTYYLQPSNKWEIYIYKKPLFVAVWVNLSTLRQNAAANSLTLNGVHGLRDRKLYMQSNKANLRADVRADAAAVNLRGHGAGEQRCRQRLPTRWRVARVKLHLALVHCAA